MVDSMVTQLSITGPWSPAKTQIKTSIPIPSSNGKGLGLYTKANATRLQIHVQPQQSSKDALIKKQ